MKITIVFHQHEEQPFVVQIWFALSWVVSTEIKKNLNKIIIKPFITNFTFVFDGGGGGGFLAALAAFFWSLAALKSLNFKIHIHIYDNRFSLA